MAKGILVGIVLVLAAIAIAGYLIIRTGAMPANADERPPRFERWAAQTSLRATLAKSAPTTDAPIPANDQNTIAGIKLYAENCAVCHGDATGNNMTKIAKGLYQRPPQLGKHGVEDDPVGVTYWKVAHGIRWTGMPAFDRSLNDTQIWQLSLFLKNMDHLSQTAHRVWQQVKTRS